MKYLILASALILGVFSQTTIDPKDTRWGWTDYKQLACQTGYNKVANYCVKCDTANGKFFDTVTKQCRSCPTGTKYNQNLQTCQCQSAPATCTLPQTINPTTGKCECSGGRTFVGTQCKCPDDKPLWNNKNCVSCPVGTTYQPKDRQCYYCPEGFIMDTVNHNCKPGLGHLFQTRQ